MWKRRRTWFLRRLVLGLAVAAFAAPAAQAQQPTASDSGVVCTPKWGCDYQSGLELTDYPSAVGRESVESWLASQSRGEHFSSPVERDALAANLSQRSWPGVNPATWYEDSRSSSPRTLPQDGSGDPTEVVRAPRSVAPDSAAYAASDVDWADLGLGAGFAFGLVLLAAGAAVATRQLRKSATA